MILLDGIGIQSHYCTATSDEEIKEAYSNYFKTGKKLQVTELDVTNDGKKQDFDYQTNRVFRTVLDCAMSTGVELINVWGVSSNISWKSKKVNNYLDEDGNIAVYSNKLVDTYSKKRKSRNEKQTVNDNHSL